jgi:hypothetical protein
MHKIIKSASSIEKQRLDILPNHKKASPKVTKGHEDSHSNKSKASAKASFWGSLDISSGIEKLFEVMGLYNKSKTLIKSKHLCSIKNIIQLSNSELHDLGKMFSCQDLRDSVFQDSIIKVLCLGECFKTLIKEKYGLDNDDVDVTELLILSTFDEETNFLGYWQIRKDFLNYLDDFTTQDSLIGSTISTTSKKHQSSVSNASTPSVLSNNTEISKTSAKSNVHDFYPKHLNHAFMLKPDFEGYRNQMKKSYEQEQYPSAKDDHQMPDHPSAFMKMIKGRSQAISAANDQRRQVLPSRVIWDGSIDRFELFRNSVEGHYEQIGVGYLFDSEFQTAYLEKGVDCYVDVKDEVPTASQIKKDARALYGALLSACQGGIGRRILMEYSNKQDGIRAWYQLINQYETDGNTNVRIKKLENVITTVFNRHYKGGLFKWIQDYEDAFTELIILGQTTWSNDDIKKRRLV